MFPVTSHKPIAVVGRQVTGASQRPESYLRRGKVLDLVRVLWGRLGSEVAVDPSVLLRATVSEEIDEEGLAKVLDVGLVEVLDF
jgi:hypothetical protein